MNYPKMVQPFALNCTCHVMLGESSVNEDGEEVTAFEADLKGNIQFKQIQKLTAKKEQITISGQVLFDGDICPDISVIHGGTLIHKGENYGIYAGQKHLNPDGTVNYTSLELM